MLVYAPAVVAVRALALEAVPGLLWLGAFAATGDRRFFFPFTLYYAVVFGQVWAYGFAAGAGLVIGLFTMIRIEQMASLRVIAVELLVAVVAVLVGAVCRRYGVMAAAGAASAVALAGLVF